jgi:hypothetical protein
MLHSACVEVDRLRSPAHLYLILKARLLSLFPAGLETGSEAGGSEILKLFLAPALVLHLCLLLAARTRLLCRRHFGTCHVILNVADDGLLGKLSCLCPIQSRNESASLAEASGSISSACGGELGVETN